VNSRDEILARVRRNQPTPRPLPDVPAFDAGRSNTFETFAVNLARMGGRVIAAPAQANLDKLIGELFPDAGVICSAAREVSGNRPLSTVATPAGLHDVDVGVVRALFGVAETGSVCLSEAQFTVNALGFLSQHLVVLLDPRALVTTLHQAYHHPGFASASYVVLMTGPSATADIEGVLIHGAQGIRTMTVIPAVS
jgi:L-lactate dehydrogenase complex protein LldG